MTKKLDVQKFIARVTELAKNRLSQQKLISIGDLRQIHKKKKSTLLVIDDDETIRMSLMRFFNGHGYSVLAAGSALELNTIIQDADFDLVILDIGLPWVDGFEIANLLQENHLANQIPIVFLSAHDDVEMMKKGFASGAHDFITKPFDLNHLKKTIEVLLELSE